MIGLLSDSRGDLGAFDAAYELLCTLGARRFLFAGGNWADLDAWLLERQRHLRAGGGRTPLPVYLDEAQRIPAPLALTPAAPDEDWVQLKGRFQRTPERGSPQYADPAVPRKVLDMVGDGLCCLVHDKNDLTREDLENASLFIHGADPEPRVVQIGPRFFLSPGSLSGVATPTCAFLDKGERGLRFTAYTLDGSVAVEPQLVEPERRTRLTVR